MLKSLRKLKGRSLGEVRDRTRYQAETTLEKLGLSAKAKLPSTEALLKEFGLDGSVSDRELSDQLLTRNANGFCRSFQDAKLTTEVFRRRFPDEADSVIKRAERICEGRFDLLGFKDLSFGSE